MFNFILQNSCSCIKKNSNCKIEHLDDTIQKLDVPTTRVMSLRDIAGLDVDVH